MTDFLVTYYNPETLERDSNGVFGLDDKRFFGKNFIPLILDGVVNPKFIDFASKVQFFRCECDFGTASFRCEIRSSKKHGEKQYWYGYKRTNGKLKKFNIGDLTKLNQETIENAIAYVCGLNEVTQEVTQEVCNKFGLGDKVLYANPKLPYEKQRGIGEIVGISDEHYYIIWQDDPKMEAPYSRLYSRPDELVLAAGHGKSDRHIQPSLMELANDPVKLLTHKNKELERQNKDLNKRLIEALDKLEQHRNIGLAVAVVQERNQELEKTLEERDNELLKTHQKLLERDHTIKMQANLIALLRQDVDRLNHRIVDMEIESSKREDDVQGYAYMYDEHSNKIFEYQALIEKYRAMTIDKTKKGNPRYAYLIDFLADIDKLS